MAFSVTAAAGSPPSAASLVAGPPGVGSREPPASVAGPPVAGIVAVCREKAGQRRVGSAGLLTSPGEFSE